MRSPLTLPSVTIVGGGLSGTLCAVHLLRVLRIPCRIQIVERSGEVGPGVAYRTKEPGHVLNVRASAMGGISGQSSHFFDWIQGPRGAAEGRAWGITDASPDAFLPRGVYAAYLRDLLLEAERGARDGVSFDRILTEAIDVKVGADGIGHVWLADGRMLESHAIVLAIGNLRPAHPTRDELPFYETPFYVHDPWSPSALEHIRRDSRVLVVGSNLTMLDVVISLAKQGHKGTVHALSRHGLLPTEHASRPAPHGTRASLGAANVRDAVRRLRSRICEVSATVPGTDWRGEVDSFRWEVASLWSSLPDSERRRFARHVRPFWDAHRHRAAPASYLDLERARASGRWRLLVGRVQRFRESAGEVEAVLTRRGSSTPETLAYDLVVNTTGPAADYRGARDSLLAQLFREGLVRPGSLGLGFDALSNGALLDAAGRPSRVLSTLGPTLRGVLWETTAVPEIRDQALALAERIRRSLPSD